MPESAKGSEQPQPPQSETLSGSLSERLEEFRREMTSALEAAGRQAVAEIMKTVTAVDGATTQPDILLALLEGCSRFASRAAFFLTRPGAIQGWASTGFGRGAAAIEGLELEYGEGAWAELARGVGAVSLDEGECAELCGRIGVPPGSEGVLVPFALRGQLGGALYADRLAGEGRLDVASLQLVTHAAAQALETVAFRGGISPALRSSGEAGVEATGIPLWQAPAPPPVAEAPTAEAAEPIAAEAPAEEEVEVPVEEEVEAPAEEEMVAAEEPEEEKVETVPGEPLPEVTAEAAEPHETAAELGFETAESVVPEPAAEELAEEPEPELEDTSADIWALEEDEEPTEVGVAPEPIAAAPEPSPPPSEMVGQETVRLDVAGFQGPEGVPPPAAQEFRPPELEPAAPPEVVPPAVAEREAAPPPEPEIAAPEPADLSEAPTFISREPLVPAPPPEPEIAPPPEPETAPPPPADYVPAAPAVERRPEPPPSSTEVAPPAGLEGPGSAFAKSPPQEMAEGEDALHEEARRLARLLVSEIKLYNEEIIDEGRRHADIYDRLKDDIDRSRQMYEERIDPRLRGREDYFHQELVQRLAGGDESLLGM